MFVDEHSHGEEDGGGHVESDESPCGSSFVCVEFVGVGCGEGRDAYAGEEADVSDGGLEVEDELCTLEFVGVLFFLFFVLVIGEAMVGRGNGLGKNIVSGSGHE